MPFIHFSFSLKLINKFDDSSLLLINLDLMWYDLQKKYNTEYQSQLLLES